MSISVSDKIQIDDWVEVVFPEPCGKHVVRVSGIFRKGKDLEPTVQFMIDWDEGPIMYERPMKDVKKTKRKQEKNNMIYKITADHGDCEWYLEGPEFDIDAEFNKFCERLERSPNRPVWDAGRPWGYDSTDEKWRRLMFATEEEMSERRQANDRYQAAVDAWQIEFDAWKIREEEQRALLAEELVGNHEPLQLAELFYHYLLQYQYCKGVTCQWLCI